MANTQCSKHDYLISEGGTCAHCEEEQRRDKQAKKSPAKLPAKSSGKKPAAE